MWSSPTTAVTSDSRRTTDVRARGGLLETRLGRRLFVLFLLAAMVPVALMGTLAYTHVRDELHRELASRVTRNAKMSGLTTLASLERLDDVFRQAVVQRAPGDSGAAMPSGFVDRRVARMDDGVPDFVGDAGFQRALTDDERAHLLAGRTLMVYADSGDHAAVAMARSRAPQRLEAGIVWARLSDAALWNATDESLAEDGDRLCVLVAATARPIHCDTPPPPSAVEALASVRREGGTSLVDWARGDSAYVAASWTALLRFGYGSSEWRFIVSEDESRTTTPLHRFTIAFVPVSLLALLIVFFLSHVQIRRSTEPLAQLTDGTRRLQEGDFVTPVTVTSRDEFAELAQSFNGMARSLDLQFTSLRNLDALHRAVLGARELRPLVDTALSRFGALIPQCDAVVAICSPDGGRLDAATIDSHGTHRHGVVSRLTAVERSVLLSQPQGVRCTGGEGACAFLTTLQVEWGGRDVFVMPLLREADLLGVVALSAPGASLDDARTTAVRRLADRLALGVADVQLVRELESLSAGTLTAFARVVDANSAWTAGHSERVTSISLAIGERLGLSGREMDSLRRGGLLHDIGKIGVPPAILDKAGPLSDAEREVMMSHPSLGAQILQPIDAFADAIPIVRSHHERLDGGGYPDGLRGDDIPYLARILAVADVFDALVSDRPYRAGLPMARAVGIITESVGTHFDAAAVSAFLAAVNDGKVSLMMAERQAATSLANVVSRARRALGAAA